MDILQAIADPKVFGLFFRNKEDWEAWMAFLAVLFGLPLDAKQRALYRQCTGRNDRPRGFIEAWLVCGRRAGKSFMLAVIAVFLACFFDWRPYLGPGERATIMIIAADRKQARVIMRYIKGLLKDVPMLARTIEGERVEAIDLANQISIEVHTASFRTVRGYTIVAALLDEVAFWPQEDSSNPDTEIIAAIRPAMVTVPGAMMLCASSPHARRGALWEAYSRHYGKNDDPILIWQAPTRVMHPSVPQRIIDDALALDPAKASAEYLATFRTDVEAFISREAVAACVENGVRERAPLPDTMYHGFVDPSGGSSDAMTMAVAHREDDRVVLDAVREIRPPFSPEAVCDEFASTFKAYRIAQIRGDRYAGEWPREQFSKRGIQYIPATKTKSELYLELLPPINSRQVELLDNDRLLAQLCSLERRSGRSGRDTIDHAPGAHDDLANSVAGVLQLARGAHQLRVADVGPIYVYADAPSRRVNLNNDPEVMTFHDFAVRG